MYGNKIPVEYGSLGQNSEKSRKRPGKEPSLPDEALTPEDLFRRNNRRKRNREAAKRVRERRNAKMEHLEEQIKTLKREHKDRIQFFLHFLILRTFSPDDSFYIQAVERD